MARKKWFTLAVAMQLVFLIIMIALKWSTLAYGTKILLKTQPIDPWDLFRGQYVTLNYEIANLNLANLQTDGQPFNSKETVYVVVNQSGKYWTAKSISHKKPETNQLFIKGEVNYFDEYNRTLMVNYGLDSYYIPENQGGAIETQARTTPLEVEVSLDRRGSSAISRIFLDGKEIKFQ